MGSQQIQENTTYQSFVEKDKYTEFIYKSPHQNPNSYQFKVILTREQGDAWIGVNVQTKSKLTFQNKDSNLNQPPIQTTGSDSSQQVDLSQFIWQNYNSIDKDIIYIDSSSIANCYLVEEDCHYIIRISAISDCKFTLVLQCSDNAGIALNQHNKFLFSNIGENNTISDLDYWIQTNYNFSIFFLVTKGRINVTVNNLNLTIIEREDNGQEMQEYKQIMVPNIENYQNNQKKSQNLNFQVNVRSRNEVEYILYWQNIGEVVGQDTDFVKFLTYIFILVGMIFLAVILYVSIKYYRFHEGKKYNSIELPGTSLATVDNNQLSQLENSQSQVSQEQQQIENMSNQEGMQQQNTTNVNNKQDYVTIDSQQIQNESKRD